MRICLLLPYDLDFHGGVREVVFHLSRELERRGHETTVVAPASGTRERSRPPRLVAVQTQPVVLPVNGSIARVIGLDWRAWEMISDRVRSGGFDVVHLHEPILWLPLLWGRFERVPPTFVGTYHAAGEPGEMGNVPDMVELVIENFFANLNRSNDRIGDVARLQRLASGIATRLSPRLGMSGQADAGDGHATPGARLARLGRPVVTSLLRHVDVAIAVSRSASDFATSCGVAPDLIIPNGVELDEFAGVERRFTVEDRPIVLFFSRVDERKGLDTLIRAMPIVRRRVAGARLIVAGSFALSDDRVVAYRDMAARLSIDAQFMATPTDAEKRDLFARATVLCAPALGQESFGIILVEALAAGLPIVASDLAAFRDVLDGGRLGLLVPPADEAALADALVQALVNPELRRRLSTDGNAYVVRFSWDVVADQTLAAYETGLAKLKPVTARRN